MSVLCMRKKRLREVNKINLKTACRWQHQDLNQSSDDENLYFSLCIEISPQINGLTCIRNPDDKLKVSLD